MSSLPSSLTLLLLFFFLDSKFPPLWALPVSHVVTMSGAAGHRQHVANVWFIAASGCCQGKDRHTRYHLHSDWTVLTSNPWPLWSWCQRLLSLPLSAPLTHQHAITSPLLPACLHSHCHFIFQETSTAVRYVAFTGCCCCCCCLNPWSVHFRVFPVPYGDR